MQPFPTKPQNTKEIALGANPLETQVGDNYRIHFGAPGYGYTDYTITRFEGNQAYGIPTQVNGGILDPEDCI